MNFPLKQVRLKSSLKYTTNPNGPNSDIEGKYLDLYEKTIQGNYFCILPDLSGFIEVDQRDIDDNRKEENFWFCCGVKRPITQSCSCGEKFN